jgi:hypothetical protein
MRILPFVVLIFSALLAACASEISNPLMGGAFVDPGKYEFYSCDQIAANRKNVEKRSQELKLLMDKAEKGAGGAVVNVIAYKGEYVMTQDELKVIDATAREKKMQNPRELEQHFRHQVRELCFQLWSVWLSPAASSWQRYDNAD